MSRNPHDRGLGERHGDPRPVSRSSTTPLPCWGDATPSRGRQPATDALVLPGRFAPLRRIGEGGQAQVWLVFDHLLAESVALKLFSPALSDAARRRVRRELRLARSLLHPRLIRVFEVIEADGWVGMVMEWLPGGTLAERVRRGPLDAAEVIAVAGQALDALAYLHERRIVHRDVKPGNLLLDANGDLRLADLGLALPLESAEAEIACSGTPAYLSPERLRGEPAGPLSDLYALGVTLYQLLTGELPFQGRPGEELVREHLHAPIPDPSRRAPDCPRWLARFVMRLMAKVPERRFADAATARRALLRHGDGELPQFWRRVAALTSGITGLLTLITP